MGFFFPNFFFLVSLVFESVLSFFFWAGGMSGRKKKDFGWKK